LLVVYHIWCGKLMLDFRAGRNRKSHVWFRWFNEAPTLVLFAVVILVVLKPF
jgi:putative membrane protein